MKIEILFYFIIFFFISVLFLYQYHINNSNNLYETDNDEILDYKVKQKNKINEAGADAFNIKEFDCINENIIIHNKFKTELLEFELEKELKKKEILEKLQKEKELKKKQFDINLKNKIKENNIIEINKLKDEIIMMNKLFKTDIHNLYTDIKRNNISKSEQNELKKNLYNNITALKQIINKENNTIKIKLLNTKLKLLEKKLSYYIKLIN